MPKYKQNRLLFMSYNERNLDSHGQIYSFTIYYNKLPCTFISEIYIHKYHRNNVPTNRIDIVSPSIVKDKLINDIYRVLILHPQDKLGMKILTLNIDYASKLHSRTLVLYVKRDIEDFNHRYNYEMNFDKLEIQTLAGSCGEILYAIQKPTLKYFIEEYEEKFELDYVEYFAIPLEENKRINMRMAFSNYRDNTVCYF